MDFTIFVGPLLGGVIGYITNDVAIRMLFRPHQAKYIFGIHVPFTPGIIPKEKPRIANAIGEAITENLMNREVLEQNLLSDEMIEKLNTAIDEFFTVQSDNDETLKTFLQHYVSENEIDSFATNVNKEFTNMIHGKLSDSELGDKIAHIAVQHVMQKMKHTGSGLGDSLSDIGIGKGGGIGDMISNTFGKIFGKKTQTSVGNFVNNLAAPVERQLAKNINEMLKNNSKEIVGNIVSKEIDSLTNRRMSALLEGKEQQAQKVKESVVSIYKTVVKEQLPRILQDMDLAKMIENRINDMDFNETEEIILKIMKNELNAIVWFGALLGFVIGWVNTLMPWITGLFKS